MKLKTTSDLMLTDCYFKIRYTYLTSNWKQFYRGGGSQKAHIFTKQNKLFHKCYLFILFYNINNLRGKKEVAIKKVQPRDMGNI